LLKIDRNLYMKKWYFDLPPERKREIIARVRDYQRKNPDKQRRWRRTWLLNHKSEHAAASMKYYYRKTLAIKLSKFFGLQSNLQSQTIPEIG